MDLELDGRRVLIKPELHIDAVGHGLYMHPAFDP